MRTLDDALETLRGNTASDAVMLLAPERGVTRLRSSGRLQTNDTAILRDLVGTHLSANVQNSEAPIIINKVRDQKSRELIPFRFLCAALRQGTRTLGTIVCVRRSDETAYGSRESAQMDDLRDDLAGLLVGQSDEITGLLTRAAFELEAARLLSAQSAMQFSVVHINVDRLHVVNDLFGYEAGNAVLRGVGSAIRAQTFPLGGAACRMSGDQFAVLMLKCNVPTTREWARALQLTISQMPMPESCTGLEITTSMGIAESVPQARIEQTLATAETATKAAKERGRNRIETFAANDVSLMQRHEDVAIFRNLVGALRAGEFQLFAQPIVSLVDPAAGPRYEILLRMLGRDGKIITPAHFMSAATRYQLLPQLDRWVLSATLQALAPHVHVLSSQNASFSVNLSGPTIAEPAFSQSVRTAFRTYEVPSSLVSFEITESAAIRSLDTAKGFINDLRAIGCRFSLDDFGTGLSSLSYLKDLRVGTLKIDGSFIRELGKNPHSETMVRAILDIARELGMETVAEYVESVEIAAQVRAMGVTYAQGYAFGRPRPLEEVLQELQQPLQSEEQDWYAGRVAAA